MLLLARTLFGEHFDDVGNHVASAFDHDGIANANVFASDLGNLTVRKITSGGSVSTFVGAPGQGGGIDGTGTTLVISGLRMVRTTTREEKVPGLGELPILGWLFKNHRTQQQQTDLYFFLTPTLL